MPPAKRVVMTDFFGLCRILFSSASEYRRLPEKPGKQRHQRDADQCHTAIGHELLHALGFGTEVLIRQVISPKIKEAETLDKSRLSALFAGVPDRNRTCDVSLRRAPTYCHSLSI